MGAGRTQLGEFAFFPIKPYPEQRAVIFRLCWFRLASGWMSVFGFAHLAEPLLFAIASTIAMNRLLALMDSGG